MNLNNIKFTPAQALVINAIFSLLGTALVGAISATYQYYVQHGLNAGILINLMLVTFLALFAKALHDYVPAHARDLLQAYKDSEEQARTGFQEVINHMTVQQPVLQTQQALAASQGPLVVIHTTTQAVPAPTQSVSISQPDITATASPIQATLPPVMLSYADPLATPGMIPVVQPPVTNNVLQHVTQPEIPPAMANLPSAMVNLGYGGDTWTRVQAAASVAAATAGQQ